MCKPSIMSELLHLDNDFKQQKLRAWRPIMSASTMMPLMFAASAFFIPIGIGLITTSEKIKEKVIEYSDHPNCQHCRSGPLIPGNCTCRIDVKVETKWAGDVYFLYGLSNFYQNHYRYINSRDNQQLRGKLNNETVAKSCKGYDKDTNGTIYAPCGALANSMFTDKFILTSDTYGKVMMTYKGITWPSDHNTSFNNPPGNISDAFKPFAQPKNWEKPVYRLDEENDDNNGFLNNDLIVWMRVAAFPNFRKLYRVLDRSISQFQNGLPAGDYSLVVDYKYPVHGFGGKKVFVMTTSSWIGGKNHKFGVVYIVFGCVCLFVAFFFLILHMHLRTQNLLDRKFQRVTDNT